MRDPQSEIGNLIPSHLTNSQPPTSAGNFTPFLSMLVYANQCVLSDNIVSGGPGNTGATTSGALGFGGAIYSLGNLLLTNLTFSGNIVVGGIRENLFSTSGYGGALYIASGNAFITHSLFNTNLALSAEAKYSADAVGAAGFLETGNLTVTRCQFTGNSAIGGSSLASAAGRGGNALSGVGSGGDF
jgi:hypothetical protein